jgi:hypothetical protein
VARPIIAATLFGSSRNRLAIGFDGQADVAERELGISFGDAEIGRPAPLRPAAA